MLRRLALRALGVLLALFAAAEIFIQANRGDLPEVDDSEFASAWKPVPDEGNGFLALREAAAALVDGQAAYELRRRFRVEGVWDDEAAQALVEKNAAALRALHSAVDAPAFQDPAPRGVADPTPEYVIGFQTIAQLAAVRTLSRARAGDDAGSLADALRAVGLGLRLQADPGSSLAEGLVGDTIQGIGLDAIRTASAYLEPTPSESRRLARDLGGLQPAAAAWRSILATEYRNMKESFALGARLEEEGKLPDSQNPLLRHLVPQDYTFKPNATLALLAERTRRDQGNAGRCPPLREPEGSLFSALLGLVGPNGLGWAISGIATVSRWTALHPCRAQVRIAATQALLGLRAHQLERGRLPDSLAELVPDYLDEVPRDPFDGAPLRYLPEQRLLYSVGADLLDEGGAERGEEKELLEPRFPIPF
jgi:hypothetical protein